MGIDRTHFQSSPRPAYIRHQHDGPSISATKMITSELQVPLQGFEDVTPIPQDDGPDPVVPIAYRNNCEWYDKWILRIHRTTTVEIRRTTVRLCPKYTTRWIPVFSFQFSLFFRKLQITLNPYAEYQFSFLIFRCFFTNYKESTCWIPVFFSRFSLLFH